MSQVMPPLLSHPLANLRLINGTQMQAIDLKAFIQNQSEQDGNLRFAAIQSNGDPLPQGLEFSQDGIISGMPIGLRNKDPYKITIVAKNKAQVPLMTELKCWVGLPGEEILDEDESENQQLTGDDLNNETGLASDATQALDLGLDNNADINNTPQNSSLEDASVKDVSLDDSNDGMDEFDNPDQEYENNLTDSSDNFITDSDSDETLAIQAAIDKLPPRGEETFIEYLQEIYGVAEDEPATRSLDDDAADLWQAMMDDGPLPPLSELLNQSVTTDDVNYLLRQFATLIIWNMDDPRDPSVSTLLELQGKSPEFNIHDRGSCIIIGPKSLYSHNRSLQHAYDTIEAAMGEIQRRGWTMVSCEGHNNLLRFAWIEAQNLAANTGHHIDFIGYDPSPSDVQAYKRAVTNANLQQQAKR